MPKKNNPKYKLMVTIEAMKHFAKLRSSIFNMYAKNFRITEFSADPRKITMIEFIFNL
ncbi:hypothetical protein D3C78_1872060 [compost metagenome]